MKRKMVAIILSLCIMIVALVGCDLTTPLAPPRAPSQIIDSNASDLPDNSPGIITEIEYVAVPMVASGLVYNGEVQWCGVIESDKYTIRGDISATAAGEYVCEVSLKNRLTMRWEDGTTGKKKLVWRIAPQRVTVSGLTFEDKTTRQYGDENCSILVAGDLPEVAEVVYVCQDMILSADYSLPNVGEYDIRAYIVLRPEYAGNYELDGELEYSATLKVVGQLGFCESGI